MRAAHCQSEFVMGHRISVNNLLRSGLLGAGAAHRRGQLVPKEADLEQRWAVLEE